ncbi:transposase [Paraburkholderia sp. 31.1]|uniref:transposase n=1 Tax=Paraburkholderia sp. 31.1 TaxID=2615205 RepID=UPI00397722C2
MTRWSTPFHTSGASGTYPAQAANRSGRPGLQFRTPSATLARAKHHAMLAKIGSPHGSGLGKTRWPVERSIAWLHSFRRLKIRYERYAHVHEAFLSLACALICWTRLKPLFN